ncbi:uncharacterized protein LOC134690668 [Mytilus trossulus]|uniref:uncharacterized protein LOC134690668 n=1 Tax=Mytilus trossulus TaxID=6551 RepID=UPI003004126D
MSSNRRNCCRKCCGFFGSIICPGQVPEEHKTKITNTNRVYILWIVLIAIFLTAGLVQLLHKNNQFNVITVQDQMYYVDWFSNKWCSGVNITSKGYPVEVNAYLLPKLTSSKDVCQHSTDTVSRINKTPVPGNDIYYRKVSLKQGDRISGKICAPSIEKIYIFTRFMDFKSCILTDSWTRCGINGPTRYVLNSSCTDYNTFDNAFQLPPKTMTKSGDLYYVFYNKLATISFVSAIFTKPLPNTILLNRAQRICLDQTLCQLDYGSIYDSYAVCFEAVRKSPFSWHPDVDNNVKVACRRRQWFYVLLFFVVPFIIGILGSVLICLCCKHNSSVVDRHRMNSAGIGYSDRHIERYTVTNNNNRFSNIQDNYRNTFNRQEVTNDTIGGIRDQETIDLDRESADRHVNHLPPSLHNPPPSYDRESADRHGNHLPPTVHDPPPSYDEVMKGTPV